MANRKPALYYALVSGYHPTLPGRIMAVTSESKETDWKGRRKVFGRDEDHGSATRRCVADVLHRFKDWLEVEAFEQACREADEAADERYAKEAAAHEHYRKMMMKFDGAMKAKRDMAWQAKRDLLDGLKEKACV